MSLGLRLRALRSAKEIGLREVAKGSGVSASTISRYERNLDAFDVRIISALAKFYGVPFSDLLDAYEPTPEQTEKVLIDAGYDLEQLRTEINALIDELKAQALATYARPKKDGVCMCECDPCKYCDQLLETTP